MYSNFANIGLIVWKPMFKFSDGIRLKPVCTETSKNTEIFAWSKIDCYTYQKSNKKGAD